MAMALKASPYRKKAAQATRNPPRTPRQEHPRPFKGRRRALCTRLVHAPVGTVLVAQSSEDVEFVDGDGFEGQSV
jgi:hypothetical protein